MNWPHHQDDMGIRTLRISPDCGSVEILAFSTGWNSAATMSAVNQAATIDADALTNLAIEVEGYLRRRLEEFDLPENLAEAIRYAVLGGGKRLRPGLVLLCCQAGGGTRQQALPAAGAIELIHTFSLVHDDLPAMDDDDLRRGRPTLHVHAGEAMAILAGDAMVTLAFEFIAHSDLDADCRIKLTGELARATPCMINGQVLDTLGGFTEGLSEQDRLGMIHHNKTGALIRAACRMGAICAKAPTATLNAITHYGEAMGLMFQIVDDLLDVTQSTEHIG